MALLALFGAVFPVYFLYQHRDKSGALWLLAVCVVLAVYPVDVLLGVGENGVRHRFSSIGLVAPLYFLAMMSYLHVQGAVFRGLRAVIIGYMLVALMAPWVPGDWYISFPTAQPYASLSQILYNLEIGAWIMKVTSYLLVLVTALVVFQRSSSAPNSRFFLLALALLPLAAGAGDLVASLTNFTPYHGVTSVQIATTIGLYVFSYVLLRHRILDRPPVSRNLLMSHLREGVCVVSSSGQIVDCNDAIGSIVGVDPDKLVGRIANHVLPEPLLAQLDEHISKGRVEDTEIYLDNTARSVSVSIKNLEEESADSSLLLSITDVTDRSNQLASVAATADQLQEANEKLLELSNTDQLTGLGNRRALLDELNLYAAKDKQGSIGLIMVDIDHFKVINDTHGHPAGDAVLVQLAQAMRDTCRDDDLITRWGGEEFIVLLHDSNEQRMRLAAERLRLHIRRLVIQLDNGVALQVTASLGAALMRPGQGSESALRQVDKLLFEAKREGRDRVKSDRAVKPE